ncbi:MAG TPA: hypothetical protein VJU84_11705 [Pyrinomonadaceae bacterium]|nr:hypothetical protein [Pyrinomonadaceae bacterium]
MTKVLLSFTLLLVLFLGAFSSVMAQQADIIGSWQARDSSMDLRVTLNADGTGTLDGAPITYKVSGSSLIVNEGGTVNNYSFKVDGNRLVVSGGNLESPLAFVRITSPGGFVRPKAGTAASEPKPKSGGLVGHWKSSEATVQIKDDGTLILNGSPFRYEVKGNNIIIGNDEGVMQFPFELSGDTLNVQVDGRTVVYRRLSEDQAQSSASSGSNPQELVGKWCYMSNVNATGGGRISNRCFTLYENGTYEFYAETTSSGPIASSASQESDSGTWSVSGGTITAHSRSRGTLVFPLEKRNHPKTGDPMLVLDGDAYVTYSPRQPW